MAREDDEFELQALFDKVLDGKATPEERRRVAELRTDPVHDEAYRAYERMTALAPEQDEKRVAALIPAGFATSVMEKVAKTPQTRPGRPWLKYAAAAVGFLLLTAGFSGRAREWVADLFRGARGHAMVWNQRNADLHVRMDCGNEPPQLIKVVALQSPWLDFRGKGPCTLTVADEMQGGTWGPSPVTGSCLAKSGERCRVAAVIESY